MVDFTTKQQGIAPHEMMRLEAPLVNKLQDFMKTLTDNPFEQVEVLRLALYNKELDCCMRILDEYEEKLLKEVNEEKIYDVNAYLKSMHEAEKQHSKHINMLFQTILLRNNNGETNE